jgi:hypothetical protein
VSIGQRLGALVVACFAVVFTRLPRLVAVGNPVMRRVLRSRLPAGPNVLLTVRGRHTGMPRTVAVAFLDLGDRCFVQAGSDRAGWLRNARVAREVVITRGTGSETYQAAELPAETAGVVIRDLLAPFPRSRLIRRVVGPTQRPPLPVLHHFRLRVDDTLEDCIALARRQPLVELRRNHS